MTPKTLPDILRQHARNRGDSQALVCGASGRRWTYHELHRQSDQVAAALASLGVVALDRVAYLDKNTLEYFPYLYGAASLGAVTVAVNWRLAPPEIEYILNHSQAKVLLVGEEFLQRLASITLEHVCKVIVIGSTAPAPLTAFDPWIAGFEAAAPTPSINPDDTCVQLYTSGTTGAPKGVETTHANLLAMFNDGHNLYRMSGQTVSLVCMPLFHIGACGWGVLSHYFGAGVVVLREADVGQIISNIPGQAVTHALLVPAVLQALVHHPDARDADFSSLQLMLYGASPISDEVLRRSLARLGCDFMQAYGLTETTGLGTLLAPEDHDPDGPRAHLLRSCGKPTGTLALKILATDGMSEAAEGEKGEICLRGTSVMKGYWRDPEATARAIDADGWLHTGDIGYLSGGYLYHYDRAKDMIITGAENVYPAEVENVLMRHPFVTDAAVIGVPSERWGETVKAVVVRSNPALTQAELIAFCGEHLARYKCPTSVDWVDSIARNPSGKILKTVLREAYWKGVARRVS